MNKALNENLSHMRVHTKLLVKAVQYEEKDFHERCSDNGAMATLTQPNSLLLRGKDKARAREWLYDCAFGKEPLPNKMMLSFLVDSLGMSTTLQVHTPHRAAATSNGHH